MYKHNTTKELFVFAAILIIVALGAACVGMSIEKNNAAKKAGIPTVNDENSAVVQTTTVYTNNQ